MCFFSCCPGAVGSAELYVQLLTSGMRPCPLAGLSQRPRLLLLFSSLAIAAEEDSRRFSINGRKVFFGLFSCLNSFQKNIYSKDK